MLWEALLVAMAVNGAVVALAWAYVARLRRVVPRGLAARVRDLAAGEGQGPPPSWPPEGRWPWLLAAELCDAADDDARRVGVNEVWSVVDHALSSRQSWPEHASRLGGLASVLVLLAGFGAGGRAELLWVVPVGVAALAACGLARRTGVRLAAVQRRRVDQAVEVLAGGLCGPVGDRRPRRTRRFHR